MGKDSAEGVRLLHSGEQLGAIDALADRAGGRVGLEGVLGDLNRAATVAEVPGRAPRRGFRWDDEDFRSRRWSPQGSSTSADQGDTDDVDGRRVVCVSWYYHPIGALNKGSRLTFVDLITREDGYSRPVQLHPGGVEHMQGETVVQGTYYVTTSAGRYRYGDLWVGRPGELRRFAEVLPIGPEIAFWPSTDQLWSLTEYPSRRYDRSDFE